MSTDWAPRRRDLRLELIVLSGALLRKPMTPPSCYARTDAFSDGAKVPQTIVVNGQPHAVESSADTPLLYVLRNELRLNGPKFGCGLAQCGACTVHLGDSAVRSCVLPVSAAAQPITTVEGLAAESPPNPLIASFVKHQAAQCGYCINGMVMVSATLLKQKPHATRAEIIAALDGNLCRCGTHLRILDAVEDAAGSKSA